MIWRTIISFFILTIISCRQPDLSGSHSDVDGAERPRLSFDTSSISIIDINSTNGQLEKGLKTIYLTQTDIYKLDNFVKLALNDLNKKTDEIRKTDSSLNPKVKMSERYYKCKLNDLKRQYIPYINDKGERCVLVICFRTDTAIPSSYSVWKAKPYPSGFGGHHAFRFVVNLSKSDYSNIQLNGVG
jgi:hypothetical protein